MYLHYDLCTLTFSCSHPPSRVVYNSFFLINQPQQSQPRYVHVIYLSGFLQSCMQCVCISLISYMLQGSLHKSFFLIKQPQQSQPKPFSIGIDLPSVDDPVSEREPATPQDAVQVCTCNLFNPLSAVLEYS